MNIFYDLRLAVRFLIHRPGFSLVVVLTMAVGIGANVAGFGYLSYFLWPTVDAPKPHELVRLETTFQKTPTSSNSYLDWLDIRKENRVFSQLAAYRLFGASLKCKDKTLYAWGHAVSGDYFSLFASVPERGRLIQASDDRPEAQGVVVLNHLFWTRHFDADPTVIGETVYLDGRHPYTVIGVARSGFQGQGLATEIYIPLASADTLVPGLDLRRDRRVQSLGRLAPNLTLDQGRASLAPLAEGLDQVYPEDEPRQMTLTPVSEPFTGPDDEIFVYAAKILMAAVALLLLLACANVANLLLARSEARGREMAILAALGAGRARLSRRLLLESLLLSTAGGLLGLLLGAWSLEVIEYYLLQTVPVGMGAWGQATSLVIDEGSLAAFAVGVSVSTGLLFGLAPVTKIFRTDLVAALKSKASGTRGARKLEMRQIMVIVQVALSVVLLLGAGLLVRTVLEARGQDFGFDSRNIVLATVYMPSRSTADEAQGKAAYQGLLDRVSTIPGVEKASLVQIIPLTGFSRSKQIVLPHLDEEVKANYNIIGPDYFETIRIPLLHGRDFEKSDRYDSSPVVVVNQAAAETFWPDRDPLGQRLLLPQQAGTDQPDSYEVVGVVADSRYQRIVDPIRPQLYLTFHQHPHSRLTFVARTALPIANRLREELRRYHPDLAIIDLVPFSEQVRRSLTDQRMNADIAVSFGLMGLLLAATGIFSVMSYGVSRRQQEFGIRLAIGASARGLSNQVLGEASRLVCGGVAIGLLSAWALARILSSILYGVSTHDPLTFVAIPLTLTAIGLLAAWLPARRASRVDPMTALREE